MSKCNFSIPCLPSKYDFWIHCVFNCYPILYYDSPMFDFFTKSAIFHLKLKVILKNLGLAFLESKFFAPTSNFRVVYISDFLKTLLLDCP